MSEIRKIILQFPSLRAFLEEYGGRISVEGMLLRNEAPPAAGSRVDIEVIVAEGMRLLRAQGETLWSGTGGVGGKQKAAAVRFDELDEASRMLIGKIVDQRRRDGAAPFILADVPGPRQPRLPDLAMPAAVVSAESAEPAGGAADSIFDLAAPPVAAESGLFSSADAAEPSPTAAAEGPARVRQPAPPVPLLAEPDSAAFDLVPEPTAGERQGVPQPPPQANLNELFGGDSPEMAPARGRTEAFPPGFVDEVEAELEAAETTEDPDPLVDTGELEAHLASPADEPQPVAPAAEPASEPSPAPVIDSELDRAPEPSTALEAELPPGPESSPPGVSPQVAQAFDAAPGPETAEIPIAELPPGAVSLDDNLLSILVPGLESAPVEAPSGPAVPSDLPSSAESLRGAAGRSRHLGTWLLIALLVGALAVAGYFLLGLVRGGAGPSEPGVRVSSPPEPPPAMPEAAPDQALAGAAAVLPGEAAIPAPAGDEAAPTTVEEPVPAESAAADGAPLPLAAPLTALNRITWNENDSETVLALLGNGAIARERVELTAIGSGEPRLVIKISGVQRPFQPAVLEVGTAHVRRVRTGLHGGGELHVVVDLAAPGVSAGDLEVRGSRLEVRLEAE